MDKTTEYRYSGAYPGGKCPAGWKRIPSLRFSVRYDTRRVILGGWKGVPPIKLACGNVSAPFFLYEVSRRADIIIRSPWDTTSIRTLLMVGLMM